MKNEINKENATFDIAKYIILPSLIVAATNYFIHFAYIFIKTGINGSNIQEFGNAVKYNGFGILCSLAVIFVYKNK
jgi:hypothetical protein